MPKREPTYCDNCGFKLFITKPDGSRVDQARKYHEFTELPYSVESANKGESGIVCDVCHKLKTGALKPDPHVNTPDGCIYFMALQAIGSKLDASKDGRITSSDFRTILQDTIRGDMIDHIIDPLPIDAEDD